MYKNAVLSCAKYCQKIRERLIKTAVKGINTYPKKKKNKREYGRERYKNLPEDAKQKLIEYRKKQKLIKNKSAS